MTVAYRPPCDDGVVGAAPPAPPCPEQTGRWVLAATILGSSMAFIDGSAVNVALPRIQQVLDATIVDAQWVVESYALTLAALMLLGGSAGDRFGRKRVYATGLVVFTLASVWCGLAPNVTQLIVARGVQGMGGALLVPGSLALISATFDDAERGRAIGTWAGFTAITAALGPVLGGWLTDEVSWRGIFFINVPLAALTLGIVGARVPESGGSAKALDVPGAVTATTGLALLVFGFIEAERLGIGHGRVIAAVLGGAALLAAFLAVERRGRDPMLPLDLFRSPTFAGTNLLTLLLYSALGGALFFFPFNLVQIQGYSATGAGAAFVPIIVIIFLLSRWSGGLVDRFGARPPLIVGPLVAGAGFALFARPDVGGSYWVTYFPAVVVLGIGMAVSVAPLTTAVMGAVGRERAGIASGVNNAVSRVASLLAVAVLGVVLVAVFRARLAAGVAAAGVPPDVRALIEAQEVHVGAIDLPHALDPATAETVTGVVREAFVAGFRAVMWVAAALAAASAVVAGVMIREQGERARNRQQEVRWEA